MDGVTLYWPHWSAPVLIEHHDALLGEVLAVTARRRQGRETLMEQLASVGFDVTVLGDSTMAWAYLYGWRHIQTDVPRIVLIDASPLCWAGRGMLSRLARASRRPSVPLIVLAGAVPWTAVVPGMVVVPLPCQCQQVTMRVLRAVGVSEAAAGDVLAHRKCGKEEGPQAWLSGCRRDEEAHLVASPRT